MKSKSEPPKVQKALEMKFYPVTRPRLKDLALFSEKHGKFRYCSCMRWRLKSSDHKRSTKPTRIAALDSLVCRGVPVGVLAYVGKEPIGWCSVAPRETYEALERFQKLKSIDEQPVWSVTCFFVDRHFRRQGVTTGLLLAAVDYARSQGARILEGYPVEPGLRLYTYMGSPETFKEAGFSDVTPAGRERLIVRLSL